MADDPPSGEAAPIVFDLVERGIIRVLDFAIFAKNEDGDVAAIDFGELPEHAAALEDSGARPRGSSGKRHRGSRCGDHTRCARRPDRLRNAWAAPFAIAVRRSGGQLVSSERIPVQAFLAALDAVEAA